MSHKQKIPVWVSEFMSKIDRLKKKTIDKEIYQSGQNKLKILKKTGKGNCVAMSKLFREILRKYNISHVQHLIIGAMDPKEKFPHQVTIVYEDIDKIWFQSNHKIICFRAFHLLIKYASDEMDWANKGLMVLENSWLNCC